jgi:FtsZ-interacting cell division protein ZipA
MKRRTILMVGIGAAALVCLFAVGMAHEKLQSSAAYEEAPAVMETYEIKRTTTASGDEETADVKEADVKEEEKPSEKKEEKADPADIIKEAESAPPVLREEKSKYEDEAAAAAEAAQEAAEKAKEAEAQKKKAQTAKKNVNQDAGCIGDDALVW